MESLRQVLMRRDGLTRSEAEEQIAFARLCVLTNNEDPQDVLQEHFGLEPDYVFDLLDL
jgi:hypothetical protein